VVIERAINLGGLDFVEEVQEKYVMETYIQDKRIWEPVR
jgi:hypothetical protein